MCYIPSKVGRKVRYESGEVGRENWEVCRESWEVCRESWEVWSENRDVGSERWEMRSKNREVGSERRGFRKKVHYFFDHKGIHSKNPNLFFQNYTIIRKKNFIFALDKTQLSPFLSQSDIDIVRLPWTISLWFSTNALWHIAKSRYSTGEHRDIGKKRNFEINQLERAVYIAVDCFEAQ